MANSAKTRIVRNCESPPAFEQLLPPAERGHPDHRQHAEREEDEQHARAVFEEQLRRLRRASAAAAAGPVRVARQRDHREQGGQRDPAQHQPASAAHGRTLDKHGQRAALGLEDRVLDVAEVLAVGLQRQRPVAGDLDPVEVVPVEQLAASAPGRGRSGRSAAAAAASRRAPASARPGRGRARSAPRARRGSGSSPRRCTGRRSRRARRRPGRGPATSSAGSKRSRCSATSRTALFTKAVSPGRLPSSRRPSASTRRTSSASSPMPAEKPKRRPFTRPDRDRPRASGLERLGDPPRRGRRVARQAERPREHVRPAARQEAERHARRRAVQHLVDAAVPREDDHRVAAGRGQLGAVAGPLGQQRSHPRDSLELRLHGAHARLADGARVRVHDQDDFHAARMTRLARRLRATSPAGGRARRRASRSAASPRGAAESEIERRLPIAETFALQT